MNIEKDFENLIYLSEKAGELYRKGSYKECQRYLESAELFIDGIKKHLEINLKTGEAL